MSSSQLQAFVLHSKFRDYVSQKMHLTVFACVVCEHVVASMFPQTHHPLVQQESHPPWPVVLVEFVLQVCCFNMLHAVYLSLCTGKYCTALVSAFIIVAFIVSSEASLDAAEQLSPVRPKTCHNEGITAGMCHDISTTVCDTVL